LETPVCSNVANMINKKTCSNLILGKDILVD